MREIQGEVRTDPQISKPRSLSKWNLRVRDRPLWDFLKRLPLGVRSKRSRVRLGIIICMCCSTPSEASASTFPQFALNINIVSTLNNTEDQLKMIVYNPVIKSVFGIVHYKVVSSSSDVVSSRFRRLGLEWITNEDGINEHHRRGHLYWGI